MIKTLVVDDDAKSRYMLQTLLAGHSHSVVTAANGADALQLARAEPPDLVVSDILMPVMDGFALCRRWREDERLREIPFVFYTATYTNQRDEAFALEIGADRFLTKPTEPGALVAILQQVVDQYSVNSIEQDRSPVDERTYLREHNEVLVRKLELKVRSLREEIAAHERSKATLHEAEQVARALLDATSESLFLLDQNGIVLAANETTARRLGKTVNQLLGTDAFTHLPPTLAESRRKVFADVLQSSKPIEFTDTRAGMVFQTIFTPLVGQEGAVTRVGMFARDVTLQSQALAELEASERRYRQLVEGIPDMLYSYSNTRGGSTGHRRYSQRSVTLPSNSPEIRISGMTPFTRRTSPKLTARSRDSRSVNRSRWSTAFGTRWANGTGCRTVPSVGASPEMRRLSKVSRATSRRENVPRPRCNGYSMKTAVWRVKRSWLKKTNAGIWRGSCTMSWVSHWSPSRWTRSTYEAPVGICLRK